MYNNALAAKPLQDEHRVVAIVPLDQALARSLRRESRSTA